MLLKDEPTLVWASIISSLSTGSSGESIDIMEG